MEIKGKFLVSIKEFENGGVAYSTPITRGEDKNKITNYLRVFISDDVDELIYDNIDDDKNYVVLDVTNAWLTPYEYNKETKLALFINKATLSKPKQDINKPIKRTRK